LVNQKIGILVKNQNFGQKSKFWSKIEILVKNQNFGQKRNFGQKWFKKWFKNSKTQKNKSIVNIFMSKVFKTKHFRQKI